MSIRIFDISRKEKLPYLVCSHQETALRGWGLSRVCSRHGGVGRLLACDSHLPSSAPLPCSPSRSLCSGTPSAGSHSLLIGQGTLLRAMGNPLKGMGNLSRGSGSPLEGPGSLWCSLCAPQIQVLCPAYSLEKKNDFTFLWKIAGSAPVRAISASTGEAKAGGGGGCGYSGPQEPQGLAGTISTRSGGFGRGLKWKLSLRALEKFTSQSWRDFGNLYWLFLDKHL